MRLPRPAVPAPARLVGPPGWGPPEYDDLTGDDDRPAIVEPRSAPWPPGERRDEYAPSTDVLAALVEARR